MNRGIFLIVHFGLQGKEGAIVSSTPGYATAVGACNITFHCSKKM